MAEVTGMIARRRFLSGLLAGVALPVWAEAPTRSPRPQTRPETRPEARPETRAGVADTEGGRRLVEAAKLGGAVGYVVADLASGQVLEASNADLPMPPASVAKTLTTLYALEKLGPNHRIETRVMRVGELSGGRIDGDLILAGGGDPTLDTDQLGDLAAALAARGVREVTGRYLAYAGALPTVARIAADQPDQVGYNPGISGLILNFNRVYFEWKRAGAGAGTGAGDDWAVSMDARGTRFMPQVSMARMQVASRDLPLFTLDAAAGVDAWTVAASALIADGSRWLPVRHPAEYAAEVFAALCAAQGIRLPVAEIVQTLPLGAETVNSHQSEPLDAILRDMLKFSTNVTAEAVGLAASEAGSLRGSAAVMSGWARLRYGISARFADHSGLGADTRISAADMMRVMIAARQGGLPGLLKETGLADAEGKEVKANPVRVRAKTGTLNFVSALSGYLEPPEGRRLAFAIFAADVPRRTALALADREEPAGGRGWTKRARRLQGQLLRRWTEVYGG